MSDWSEPRESGQLLRCQACGGAVVWDAAHAEAACLYCATTALAPEPLDSVPSPELLLPASTSAAEADASFRAWLRSGWLRAWLRPPALREVELPLRLVLLPAWRFECELETHWAGLRVAPTRSGKAPATGLAHATFRQLVVASGGLTQAELGALGPFSEQDARPWAESLAELESGERIWEPPALTKRGAKPQAYAQLRQRHREQIASEQGLVRARVSSLIRERSVSLLMVPVYVGSYRFDARGWRVLVNARSGKVVADAPLDRRRVGLLVALGLLVLIALLLWQGL